MLDKSSILASLFALMAVVLGAFGAHALKANLDVAQLSAYEVGVRYQLYHAMALFVVGFLSRDAQTIKQRKYLSLAVWNFVLGIVLFCGSLYLLSCREMLGIVGWRWLGPLTPIGGLLFIIGWFFVLLSQTKTTDTK